MQFTFKKLTINDKSYNDVEKFRAKFLVFLWYLYYTCKNINFGLKSWFAYFFHSWKSTTNVKMSLLKITWYSGWYDIMIDTKVLLTFYYY